MQSQIKAAGDYLLSVLKAEKEVVYSRFYNAEPGTDVALVHGMWPFLMSQPVEQRGELDDGDKERLLEEAHVLLEWAAWQLEDLGVVKITTLKGSKLIDGEPDFRIELTERGMRFIEEGETFGYREPENTRFDVSEASRWMLSFLHEGGPGQTLTLRDMMDPDYQPSGLRWSPMTAGMSIRTEAIPTHGGSRFASGITPGTSTSSLCSTTRRSVRRGRNISGTSTSRRVPIAGRAAALGRAVPAGRGSRPDHVQHVGSIGGG